MYLQSDFLDVAQGTLGILGRIVDLNPIKVSRIPVYNLDCTPAPDQVLKAHRWAERSSSLYSLRHTETLAYTIMTTRSLAQPGGGRIHAVMSV
jgi:hypothetical protein